MKVCNYLLVWRKKEFEVANSLDQNYVESLLTENTKDLVWKGYNSKSIHLALDLNIIDVKEVETLLLCQ